MRAAPYLPGPAGWLWLITYVGVLIWSGIEPHDRLTWWMEVSPAMLGLAILIATRRRFPLTPLAYVLILLFAIILMVGGHYTYARVPAFDVIGGWFGWPRNNFDKLGHFAQGLVPAIVAREILLRFSVVRVRAWLAPIILAICLAISAFYELIEWWAALLNEQAVESFLGTQGYVWDTQSDMALALLGAAVALLTLSRWHDRQLAAVTSNQ
ncbi:DUF2238 domain-containing protein [Thiohalobacter thiocyanaticus]|uniref:DUF2238 domain-containing protein n=1 Tax=Thiohalobacter thiocyanaticus TaxID=585455 RepID=A0A426QL08_9GAMM|nr:DUF2238 domain-containing protein [Thiohalobacter thiocyanaticus]RRQ22376.1 DUF2238 domain-containing protein [Thiohalobacter thiocyanaticus]